MKIWAYWARAVMGEVRKVRDLVLDRVVALKSVRADLTRHGLRDRFLAEVRVTAQLQHPGIVPVHELGQLPDGRPYFTMEEVRGVSLRDAICEVHEASVGGRWEQSRSGWTLRRLVDALARVCDAVAYAHSRGVLHRDLKPHNVMLGAFGEVRVVDWGLAKVTADADESFIAAGEGVTRVGHVAGTPCYMPPEQAFGQPLDERADVYSLGAVLYYLMCGKAPYSDVARHRHYCGGPRASAERCQRACGAAAAEGSDRADATVYGA